MDAVHFLNIEYLLLKVYEVIHTSALFNAGVSTAEAPASSAINVVALSVGSLALFGMVITLIFFVTLVWIRIRLEMVEHEGFEKKEHELHAARAMIVEEHAAGPKNPRWERVRELANTTSESDWRLAILEADIMLGDLLKSEGYRGDTIGELLRDANPLQFRTLDLAWKAHKIRNDIAHGGSEFHLSQREANGTIDLYRRVFEEFDFI